MNRKHYATDYFLHYNIDCKNSVCMISSTTTVRERRQGAVSTGGGPSRVL